MALQDHQHQRSNLFNKISKIEQNRRGYVRIRHLKLQSLISKNLMVFALSPTCI